MGIKLSIFLMSMLGLSACFKNPSVQLGVIGNIKITEDPDTKMITLSDIESNKILKEYHKESTNEENKEGWEPIDSEIIKKEQEVYKIGKCYANVSNKLDNQGNVIQEEIDDFYLIEKISNALVTSTHIQNGIVTETGKTYSYWSFPKIEVPCKENITPAPHLNSCFVFGSNYLRVQRAYYGTTEYRIDVYDLGFNYLTNASIEKSTLDTLETVDCNLLSGENQ
jgi:hypothetical protein